MSKFFSEELITVMGFSKEEAIRLGSLEILPEHIFLAIYRIEDAVAVKILDFIKFPIDKHKQELERLYGEPNANLNFDDEEKLIWTKKTDVLFKRAYTEAKEQHKKNIIPELKVDSSHILLAYFKLKYNTDYLTEGLSYSDMKRTVLRFLNQDLPAQIKNDITDILTKFIDTLNTNNNDPNKKNVDIKIDVIKPIGNPEDFFKQFNKLINGGKNGDKNDNNLSNLFSLFDKDIKDNNNNKKNTKKQDQKLLPASTENEELSEEDEFFKSLENFTEDSKDDDEFDYEDIGDYDEEGEGDEYDDNFVPSWGNEQDSKKGSIIERFGTDITQLAKEKRLDPISGREIEIERIINILGRRKKNNPILIGEAGIGKTAIVEGLAMKIANMKGKNYLSSKRIININIASIVSGTVWRGQFEQRMLDLIAEIKANPDIIVFMDEIHTMLGAGDHSGGLDAANILKPALARGEFQCIGATTLNEYKKSIEKDAALERRFQKIIIQEPSEDETIKILHTVKPYYEDYHKVIFTDKAIETCARLSSKYITDRNLPDKAIDILDEAGATAKTDSNNNLPPKLIELENKLDVLNNKKIKFARNQQYEEAAAVSKEIKNIEEKLIPKINKEFSKTNVIDEKVIAEIVSRISGIPASKLATSEIEKLSKIKQILSEAVIGQEKAINEISNAIIRNRTGIRNPQKPIGSFIFLGTTGVGKTQLAKELAKYLFDSEEALIRFDMSEYMEKFSISRLIGAPPGYVGYEEGGLLTDKVRRKPYSIVLLDEIEKAHPDIFNILLQILDDGVLTDTFGRRVNFKNTILIMTSNVGTQQVAQFGKGVGFEVNVNADSYNKNAEKIIQNALSKTFSPEFLNRIDDIIVFNSLSFDDILKIVKIMLAEIFTRVRELGFELKISEKVEGFIAKQGFDSKYGARPLKRAIQKHIEDKISETIISGNFAAGDTIVFDITENEEIIVNIEKKENCILI